MSVVITGIGLSAVLPTIIHTPEKVMIPAVIIIDKGAVKVGFISSIFFEKAIEEYEKLKKEGFKPLNFEVAELMKMHEIASTSISTFLMNVFIEGLYGKDVLKEIEKKIEEDENLKNLIEMAQKMMEQTARNTMVR